MIKKALLLILILLAALAAGQGQGQAEAPRSLPTDAGEPYWPFFGYDRAHTSRSPHPGPQTAQVAWTYPAVKGRVINQQPTVDAGGSVYFATWGSVDEDARDWAHGLLYALNPDGLLKWVYDPGPAEWVPELNWAYFGTIETSPAIGPDGTIYIGRGDGILRAVNPDGTEKWTFAVYPNENGRAQIFSSPAIGPDGIIYFGTGVTAQAGAGARDLRRKGVIARSVVCDEAIPFDLRRRLLRTNRSQ